MKFDWKKILPYVVALVVFIGIAMLYCSPILEGKELKAGDVSNWKSSAHEALEYKAQTGETTWWTNSQFGGMPTFQITGNTPSGEVINHDLRKTLFLGMPETIGIVFSYFAGFFLLFICFGVSPWLSIAGALAMGLSSYFFIIIPAGHITKAIGLAFLAPVIGGVYAIFRKKYWLGAPLIIIYGMCGISLHPQMTYYMGLLIGIMGIAEFIGHALNKRWKEFGIAVGVLLLAFGIVGGTRISWMSMNNSYLKETMRGGHSELTKKTGDGKMEASQSGLSLDYVTQWSYGIDETMTLMIPNWEGSKSGYPMDKNSQLYKDLVKLQRRNIITPQQVNQIWSGYVYHGDKPFTSGAVYVGAIVCFLFLLGLLIVPGPYKWALLFATLMSIFLAWGRNMMWLTEFFFNFFPMYNKFRAVESILVVAEITMPLLGFMGLQRILSGEVEWKKLRNSLFIAGGLTAGLCLVAALFTSSFNMSSARDAYLPDIIYNNIKDSLMAERVSIAKADAWRSFLFVLAGFIAVYGFAWMQHSFGNKTKYKVALIAALVGLILGDMIPVNKRFFNDDDFVTKKENEKEFAKQQWERYILENEQSLDYRVYLDIPQAFEYARPSYRLKSIGGYSAAKLRRYQDLIDEHISKDNKQVLDMLNTKYILSNEKGIEYNENAFGNAWFVDNVQFVPTPDDESNALYSLNLHTTAVADQKFRDVLSCEADPSAADTIYLTEYKPNKLTYTAYTASERVAVFSEIYYPEGWHLYVDGKEVPIGRVNYVLRAAVIPGSDHDQTIVMEFRPDGLSKDKWSMLFVILGIILSICAITWPLWKRFLPEKVKALLAKAQ